MIKQMIKCRKTIMLGNELGFTEFKRIFSLLSNIDCYFSIGQST